MLPSKWLVSDASRKRCVKRTLSFEARRTRQIRCSQNGEVVAAESDASISVRMGQYQGAVHTARLDIARNLDYALEALHAEAPGKQRGLRVGTAHTNQPGKLLSDAICDGGLHTLHLVNCSRRGCFGASHTVSTWGARWGAARSCDETLVN